ncbi:MAG: acylneuraminate cytidylyltransferase family protein [Phycisphaerales bacterium]|nr:acylneuraminate cytidylyltransferase family protein [Phycisphaerales bacterium]NNM24875.1 acylneuraminate cytidylyltransferase family protein [Phycisphaerales bacterium]
MTEFNEIIAVIIGRAGSKGLPGKNARSVAGRPILAYSIEDAQRATTVDRILVSTDCPEMTRVAGEYGVSVITRPAALATDTATVDAAVRHAITEGGSDAGAVVILYANVPVRPDGLIDRAVDHLRVTGADSVQSYARVGKHHPAWMVRLDDDDRVEPYETNRIYRRQDLPALYLPDGGVIAVTRASLFTVDPEAPHAFLGSDRRGIRSDPARVVDIDDAFDLRLAETHLETRAGAGR